MSQIIPLSVPDELAAEIRQTAKKTDLSQADVIRQSVKLGLPRLVEQLSASQGRITNVDPLPKAVLDKLYRERDEDLDSIRQFIAAQPKDAS